MKPLPNAIQQFVKQQRALPITELCKDDDEPQPSPYGSHWYRAVAGMLLSGRVAAKMNDSPNLTDVNRICKEANFNQHYFEQIAKFLVAAKVVHPDRQGKYLEGINHTAFWKHRRQELTEITKAAFLQLIQDNTGFQTWRPTMAIHASLIEFLMVFFTCFQGSALREAQIGQVMHDFGQLPEVDLRNLATRVGLKKDDVNRDDWEYWLDEKGQKALLTALYTAEWAYYVEHHRTGWVMPSPLGLGLLGISPLPEAPALVKELKAASNLAVFAGAGLGFDKLVPLFRFCKIKRIDQLIEFQVDPRRLREIPSRKGELRAALVDLDPLPSTLAAALQTESQLGGKLAIRYCSALVKPETSEALAAIREHPQLKGYLEPGAPPGYLLVKLGLNQA